MQITQDTRVSDLLNAHPEAVEVLAEFHSHFARLRNRVLRKIMAPRVTVAQAARMAEVDVGAMLTVLRRATGQAPPPFCAGGMPLQTSAPAAPSSARPPFLDQFNGDRLVIVDVREDIRRGHEPFAKIMTSAKSLQPGQALLLRNVFEPVPLYQVLEKRGLVHWTECRGPEDWWIYFFSAPTGEPPGEGAAPPAQERAAKGGELLVDARGLEPPEPMQRILEALAKLPAGTTLRARTDRRPQLLYPKLEERGYRYETREIDDDGYETRIWR